ncbi:MAG TPA: DUF86 domain-containing protein [Acidobacteriota bacterium]|nr:DUF86 domain-containing protein [Acidobacteriota bacterium]
MYKDDEVRLRHILDAAREAFGFSEGQDRRSLEADRKLNLSLVRLLEIIGEAAKGITNDFRREHPELPWKSMIGMRDRLIHGYFDINLDIIWKTVKNDLPPLIDKIEKILAE